MGHDKRLGYPGLLRPASMGVASGLLFAVLVVTSGYGEVRNSTGVAVIIGNRRTTTSGYGGELRAPGRGGVQAVRDGRAGIR